MRRIPLQWHLQFGRVEVCLAVLQFHKPNCPPDLAGVHSQDGQTVLSFRRLRLEIQKKMMQVLIRGGGGHVIFRGDRPWFTGQKLLDKPTGQGMTVGREKATTFVAELVSGP